MAMRSQDVCTMFVLADMTLSAVGKLGENMCKSLMYVYEHADEMAKEFIAEETPDVCNYIHAKTINQSN